VLIVHIERRYAYVLSVCGTCAAGGGAVCKTKLESEAVSSSSTSVDVHINLISATAERTPKQYTVVSPANSFNDSMTAPRTTVVLILLCRTLREIGTTPNRHANRFPVFRFEVAVPPTGRDRGSRPKNRTATERT